jgi:hypothetical protein
MPPHMVCLVPFLGSDGRVRHLPISVPLIPSLLDNARYYLPGDLPETPGSRFHVGKPSAARLARALNGEKPMMEPKAAPRLEPERRTRAPSMRYLVRLALACQSAEEMGKRLKRRFDRQQQRRARLAREAAEAERLLAQA